MKIAPYRMLIKGQRIISMQLSQNDIILRDSLMFLSNTPLKAFPAVFDLPDLEKGQYPFALNKKEFVRFDGKPPQRYYEYHQGVHYYFPRLVHFAPHLKNKKELAALKLWVESQQALYASDPANYIYEPETELQRYCCTDVVLLRRGVEKYRSYWLSKYPIEPFDSVSGPSFINKIMRLAYIPPKTFPILPAQGFGCERNYSRVSMCWLFIMSQKLDLVYIRTARKFGEVNVAGFWLDGYGIDRQGHHWALDFIGCKHHACECQGARDEEQERSYRRTIRRGEILKEIGSHPDQPYGKYNYVSISQCKWQVMLKNDNELKEFAKKYNDKFNWKPLNLRDALRGGK